LYNGGLEKIYNEGYFKERQMDDKFMTQCFKSEKIIEVSSGTYTSGNELFTIKTMHYRKIMKTR